MLIALLNNIGLSEGETKVYLAALALGPTTVQHIANESGLKRTTAYTYVHGLLRKGLLSSAQRGKRATFAVEDPENLLRIAEARKNELQSATAELQRRLPQLRRSLEMAGEQPRVRFFEGREGLLTMVNDFMKSKFATVEEFTDLDAAHKILPPRQKDTRHRIAKRFKNIPMRVIYTSDRGAFLKQQEGLKRRMFVPREQFPPSGEIVIYGDKVALMSYKKDVAGVIIKSGGIAKALQTLFNLAWEENVNKKATS